jgi:hypothetical protein
MDCPLRSYQRDDRACSSGTAHSGVVAANMLIWRSLAESLHPEVLQHWRSFAEAFLCSISLTLVRLSAVLGAVPTVNHG